MLGPRASSAYKTDICFSFWYRFFMACFSSTISDLSAFKQFEEVKVLWEILSENWFWSSSALKNWAKFFTTDVYSSSLD